MFKVNKIEKINKSKANVLMTIRFPKDIYNEYKKLSEKSNQSFNKIEEELIIQNINLQISDLDEIYNLLNHIFQNRE